MAWRCVLSPLDSASTAAFSPIKDFVKNYRCTVHPTHWLICAQAIGGASGFFVGTDVAYLGGDGNFLRPIVGVEDFDSDILGIVKAGTSTGLGFCAFQSVQNVTFAQGSAWIDP